jgi:hypothetical protein
MIAVFGALTDHPEEIEATEDFEAKSMKLAAQEAKRQFEAGLERENIPVEDVVFKVTDVSEI